jgi:high-affinity nickel-transport protein
MLSLLLLALGTSFVLGMRHATDPDHIVAVTTIAAQERSLRRAAAVGALWGVGHTLTILVVGGAIVLFKLAFTPRLGLSLELAVAVMLIVLGVLNLFDVRFRPSPLAAARPVLVGVVHGLAGSAAATLIVLPLIPDPRWAVVYLLVFGVGTIAGMALMTVVIAAPSVYAAGARRAAPARHPGRVGRALGVLRPLPRAPHRLRRRAVHEHAELDAG